MKTIFVDDEIWMLAQFENECSNVEDIEMIGKFDDPFEALKFAEKNRVDLAFLDIEMPGMTGLELAAKLRELYHDMIVIFVSAYDKYMSEAFEDGNTDYYILKPYKKETVEKVLARVKLLSARLKKKVYIHTFGKFEVYVDGEPVKFTSKKAKELLAILVDHHGETVETEEAFYIMWEDKGYDHTQASGYRRALQKLQTTLREAGIIDILTYLPRGRAIKCDMVDCDYFDFLEGNKKAIKEYAGDYMSDYSWGEYTIAVLDKKKMQADPDGMDLYV